MSVKTSVGLDRPAEVVSLGSPVTGEGTDRATGYCGDPMIALVSDIDGTIGHIDTSG